MHSFRSLCTLFACIRPLCIPQITVSSMELFLSSIRQTSCLRNRTPGNAPSYLNRTQNAFVSQPRIPDWQITKLNSGRLTTTTLHISNCASLFSNDTEELR